MDAATFEDAGRRGARRRSAGLMALLQNVVVLIADEPPAGDEPDLLGLYEGIPLTERDGYYSGVLPDHITIFRGPTLRWPATGTRRCARCGSPSCTRSPTTSASTTTACTSSATA